MPSSVSKINSSNSKRLVEVGKAAGCAYAQLVQRAGDIDWRALDGVRAVGLTAGASAPEVLVDEVIDAVLDPVTGGGNITRSRPGGRIEREGIVLRSRFEEK